MAIPTLPRWTAGAPPPGLVSWINTFAGFLERILGAGQQYGVTASPAGPAGGDLSGNYPSPRLSKINGGALTAHGVLVGEGSSPINALVGAANELLQGTSGDPAWTATPTVSSITLNNGAPGEVALQHNAAGTWTPAIVGSTTAGAFTYVNQIGNYVRIGNLVTVWARVAISAVTTAPSGNLQVNGLPFVSANNGALSYPLSLGAISGITLSSGNTQYGARVQQQGSNFVLMVQTGSGAGASPIPAGNAGSSTAIELGGSYMTSAA
jgi:hypothetical protein